jgi:lysophospholipase
MKPSKEGYVPAKGYLSKQLKQMYQFHDPNYPIDKLKHPFITPCSRYGRRANFDIIEFDELLDSCNMTYVDWGTIAKTIEKYYDLYDAFIVIHGTDTMSYTASALSFLLENLGKTVIITGSQVPICQVNFSTE